jgi:hypothetical protein
MRRGGLREYREAAGASAQRAIHFPRLLSGIVRVPRGQVLNKIVNKALPSSLGIDCVLPRKVHLLVNDDEHHDMDAPNLDIEGEPPGPLHLMDPNRLF